MEPTFHEGNRLFASSLPYWLKSPSPGDVAVLFHPFYKNKKILKRIEKVRGNGTFIVRGDNPLESEDSRSFGPTAREQILGKVLFRY